MAYNDSKLEQAFKVWLAENVKVGYGSVYSAELLADFEEWLLHSHALRSSPGPVPFGRQLKAAGFSRKRVAGLTHWVGLSLKNPKPYVEPRRHASTVEANAKRLQLQGKHADHYRHRFIPTDEDREKRKQRVLAEMKKENAERIRNVGEK
jgi:hypothetical protein